MKVRTHIFAGKRYAIYTQAGLRPPDLAECNYKRRIMRIPVDGGELHELDEIIHETLHACFPWLIESLVNAAATSIARLLWRLGWRLGGE